MNLLSDEVEQVGRNTIKIQDRMFTAHNIELGFIDGGEGGSDTYGRFIIISTEAVAHHVVIFDTAVAIVDIDEEGGYLAHDWEDFFSHCHQLGYLF